MPDVHPDHGRREVLGPRRPHPGGDGPLGHGEPLRHPRPRVRPEADPRVLRLPLDRRRSTRSRSGSARKIPYSTVKAVFGFEPSTNIGLVFYTALQTVPCFWPSWAEGRSVPCLIPCGIDQDPHFRVTRDIAEGLGYPKPALLHSQMVPGPARETRDVDHGRPGRTTRCSSTTLPRTSNARSRTRSPGGGRPVEEQRRLGATPEVCSVWALWRTRFAESDAEVRGDHRRIAGRARSSAGSARPRSLERVHEFYTTPRDRPREGQGAGPRSTIIDERRRNELCRARSTDLGPGLGARRGRVGPGGGGAGGDVALGRFRRSPWTAVTKRSIGRKRECWARSGSSV